MNIAIQPMMFGTFFNMVLRAMLIIVLLLTGCEKKRGILIGDVAPQISGTDMQDRSVTHDTIKGKITVVYFWTNSCCGDSLKLLEPLYRRNKDKGLIVLAINEMDSKKDIESYAITNRLTFTMLRDEGARLFKKFSVFGFPTVFILDRNGTVREKILGDIQTNKLEKLVERQFDIQREIDAQYEKIRSR
ncbi:MAG: TlpA disulfide reductase family protein [Desulfuromonadaceae bacterium]|nr:TlpA disulfide reductase family protein [Desulfuromonadaceae bacterium]MDD5106981.1 TlpA disulfide reductase family protein [Desulfuromonadaceae bacterium]